MHFIVFRKLILCILSYFRDNFFTFYRTLQMNLVYLQLKYNAL